MKNDLFFTIQSSSSRSTPSGLRIEVNWITFDKLVDAAEQEMSKGSTGFEEMAGIKFVENAAGDLEPERALTETELMEISIEKLGDDGRLFMAFADDEAGRKDFLEMAELYGLSDQAAELVEKFKV